MPPQVELVRRARVWDAFNLHWNYILPGQRWDDGAVTSPTELEQCRSYKSVLKVRLTD